MRAASRNHHSYRGRLKRDEKDTRQILESRSCFHLQQNPQMLCMHFAKTRHQIEHIVGPVLRPHLRD